MSAITQYSTLSFVKKKKKQNLQRCTLEIKKVVLSRTTIDTFDKHKISKGLKELPFPNNIFFKKNLHYLKPMALTKFTVWSIQYENHVDMINIHEGKNV